MRSNAPTKSNSPTQDKSVQPVTLPPHDPGYYYDRKIEAGQHGEIRLSPAVQAACRCGGVPPFQVMGASGDPEWCVCRAHRVRISQIDTLIRNAQIPVPFRYKFLEDFEDTAGGQPIRDIVRLKGMLA